MGQCQTFIGIGDGNYNGVRNVRHHQGLRIKIYHRVARRFLVQKLCVMDGAVLISSHAVNSLWPSVAICWHRSGLTLAMVMAHCLMAASHYLHQIDLGSVAVTWEQFPRKYSWYQSVRWVTLKITFYLENYCPICQGGWLICLEGHVSLLNCIFEWLMWDFRKNIVNIQIILPAAIRTIVNQDAHPTPGLVH